MQHHFLHTVKHNAQHMKHVMTTLKGASRLQKGASDKNTMETAAEYTRIWAAASTDPALTHRLCSSSNVRMQVVISRTQQKGSIGMLPLSENVTTRSLGCGACAL
jgi:hypothetical protein